VFEEAGESWFGFARIFGAGCRSDPRAGGNSVLGKRGLLAVVLNVLGCGEGAALNLAVVVGGQSSD
jgi:hypothetical protein